MLKSYIPSFREELHALNISSLAMAEYPARYLQRLRTHSTYYLHIYVQVLEKAIQFSGKQKEELILLDYGAGNGLLGLFARHCGFKKVYSLDISESFQQALQQLNTVMKAPVDGLITGDWEMARNFFATQPPPDVVAGTDMIEHVYDLDAFLRGLKQLNPQMISLFTTASVTANPFKTAGIKKVQKLDEYTHQNGAGTVGDHPYAGLSFLEARKKMIGEAFALPEQEVESLARSTRGLQHADILTYTKRYIATGDSTPVTTHPTNTCDPVTGSWTERLLTIPEYNRIFNQAGFDLQVFNGFYNSWQPGLKGKILKLVNVSIAVAGRWLSPYILLIGK